MASTPPPNQPSAVPWHSELIAWGGREPLSAALLLLNAGALIYFFCFVPLFHYATETTLRWAVLAWGYPEQSHGKIVPLISLFLLWRQREAIRRAGGAGSNAGLFFVAFGVLLFVASARCLEPRIALFAFPFLIYGSVLFVWGGQMARLFLFPCALLVFMIPWAAAEQATNRLQFFITGAVKVMANLCGIHTGAVGTTLVAADGSFRFEITDGCSGVHSLTAITLLTAVFVHLLKTAFGKARDLCLFGGVRHSGKYSAHLFGHPGCKTFRERSCDKMARLRGLSLVRHRDGGDGRVQQAAESRLQPVCQGGCVAESGFL